MVTATLIVLTTVAVPARTTPPPPSPEEWLLQCPVEREDKIVGGTTMQAVGGGMLMPGIIGTVASLLGIVIVQVKDTGSSELLNPLLMAGAVDVALVVIGGVVLSSGRKKQREGLELVCPRAPPVPTDTAMPAASPTEPPTTSPPAPSEEPVENAPEPPAPTQSG
jgi:hypothetical protein